MPICRHTESAPIHGGNAVDPLTGAGSVPIDQTSAFQRRGPGLHPEWEYARTGNPTRAAFERLIKEVEEGFRGLAFVSGMAAIAAVLSNFGTGDSMLISGNVYSGTCSGAMYSIRKKKPCVGGVPADPDGSAMAGGEHGDYDIEGIGSDFIADTMDMRPVDRVIRATGREAFENARIPALREGIFAGSSSGAAPAAVRQLVDSSAGGTIVTVLPDRGDGYFNKGLYD